MEIQALEWQQHNVEKVARHGIRHTEVDEVVARDDWVPIAHDNEPDQARIIGPTYERRLLTIVLEMTDEPGVWRPVTGWESSAVEVAYYWDEQG